MAGAKVTPGRARIGYGTKTETINERKPTKLNRNCLMSSDHFERIVSQHYEPLYKFAFSLTRTEADACDLTQHTFYIWATKGHQLRDRSKVKSWLFTILHREFLNIHRRTVRFPHVELSDVTEDLPT